MQPQTVTAVTVTAVNEHIRRLLDGDKSLVNIYVQGELSNFKRHSSGQLYFSLKDEQSTIRCVMFKNAAASLQFEPQDGLQVILYGRVSVFTKGGSYQLYAEKMSPDGAGALALQFERLKRELEAKGAFDPARKKPLPQMPNVIGVVTSSTGAAVHDIIRVLGARWPLAKVKVIPALVQGPDAPPSIAAAIKYANRHRLADVLIVGRGGGSMEDLWCFNDVLVARAIYASDIPVISAVGHEPDFTICDFVADVRAATPSNGAELAVPDRADVLRKIGEQKNRLLRAMKSRLEQTQMKLHRFQSSTALKNPMQILNQRQMALDYTTQRMETSMQRKLDAYHQRIMKAKASKFLNDPAATVVQRRYALERLRNRLSNAMTKLLTFTRTKVDRLRSASVLQPQYPLRLIEKQQQRIVSAQQRLTKTVDGTMNQGRSEWIDLLTKLDALSPLKVLTRGYAFVTNGEGQVVTQAARISPCEKINVTFQDGTLVCSVIERRI